MPRHYDIEFKEKLVNLIVNEKHSTIKTAQEFEVPLKTLEKWITSYNKDNEVFKRKLLEQAKQNKNSKKVKVATK